MSNIFTNSNLKPVMLKIDSMGQYVDWAAKRGVPVKFDFPDTTVRYAKKALATPVYKQAVVAGVITDGRVMDYLSAMGMVAAQTILRIEQRLGRNLSRERVRKLAESFMFERAVVHVVQCPKIVLQERMAA